MQKEKETLFLTTFGWFVLLLSGSFRLSSLRDRELIFHFCGLSSNHQVLYTQHVLSK